MSAGRRSSVVLAVGVLVAVASVVFAATARAEPPVAPEAAPHFDRGAKLYSTGHFAEAIEEFEKAYQITPSPILLFNIAQCQRHVGNNERALFLYRRYLEQAPKASNRADAERHIAELEVVVRKEQEARRAAAARIPVAVDVEPAEPRPPPPAPRRWAVAASGAPAIVRFSRSDIDTGAVLFAARLAATYGWDVSGAALQIGLEPQLAFLPFDDAVGDRQMSLLWGLLVSGRCLFRPTPGLRAGAAAGVGLLWWSGLVAGNPFTTAAVSVGATPLPTFELGPRLQYDFPDGLFLALAPDFVLSKTTGDPLTSSVSWLWRLDLSIAAGYAF